MKIWQKMLLISSFTLLIGGSYLLYVWHQRHNPGVVANGNSQPVSMDDVAVVRALFITHFEDTKQLLNTTVWMKNGATTPYFPAKGEHIDFAHPAGKIAPTQRMEIKKIVQSAVPAAVQDGMSHGSRQVFILFSMPGKPDLFATPIGARQGDQEMYFCDLLFFYDDPHSIYDNWSKADWAAIDAHQVHAGMSELQTRMSIGQKLHFDGSQEGDRTVRYEWNNQLWTVTYVHNKATKVESGPLV